MFKELTNCLFDRVRSDGEKGITTVEYAIMLILIAIAVSGFGLGISGSVTSVFSRMLVVLGSAS